MSGSEGFPDPDLSFLEGTTGEDIAAIGRGLDDAAQQLEKQTRAIADQAQTATVDRVLDALVGIKKRLEEAAVAANQSAKAFEELKRAWETWKATAPRQSELAAAEQAVTEASGRLKAASEDGLVMVAAICRKDLKAAEAKRNKLFETREAADDELTKALVAAKEMIPGVLDVIAPRTTNPDATSPKSETPAAPAPKTLPGPTATVPGPAAPAPGGELPGASLPGAPLNSPGTGLSGMPETPAATTGSGLSPAQAGALAAALGQQQQQGQAQPQAAPAMAAMPQMPQQQPQKPNPSANSDNYDPNALLASLAAAAPMGALAGVGAAPSMSNTYASPAITPLNPTGPTFTPLNPVGSLTPAPALNPVVTGTSVSGLTTTNNVTGLADGATTRTATSPSPATNLSGAHADQTAAARPGGMGTGAGMGAPMMPMGMPMNGGMGGAGKDREMVTATMTPEQARLLGLETIGEAVPGGTIARKED